jgi:N-acetylglucosamine-6-phosphate deacetylase
VRLGVEAAVVDGVLLAGDVEIADGRIARCGLPTRSGRGIAAPGLVDLQVNGFAEVDFLDADAVDYERAGQALARTGTTAFLSALTTASPEILTGALERLARAEAPGVLGAHLEGPFISPARLGAHPASARRDPDLGLLKRLLVAGPVRLITLAPELPRAHELIRGLVEREIAVSLGHSDATAKEANEAFDLGVRTVTHVFNAMRPFTHRDPGLAGAALARDDVIVQAIIDGTHLAPETERLVWLATRGRLALVSDHAAVEGGRLEDGTLAGSTSTLLDCVRRLHDLGAPLVEALAAATSVPAQIVGESTVGQLGPRLPADVIVLDDDLEPRRVLVDGVDVL